MLVLILLFQEISPRLLIISSFPINSGGFPGGSAAQNPPANARDENLIPGSGKYPGGEHGNPLQYFCLGSPMNRGAWRAIVHGIAKESDMTEWLSTGPKWYKVVVYLLNTAQLFCEPIDYSPPGSSVHGISQARILEWIPISFLKGSAPPRDGTWISPALQLDSLPLSHQGSLI